MEVALEAGALDVKDSGKEFEVTAILGVLKE